MISTPGRTRPKAEDVVGVDWIRMRPVPGASPEVLVVLVQQQAAAFAATGNWFEGEFDHLQVDAGPGSCELVHHVDVDSGPDSYRRVSAFVLSPVFPAEWRLAAYRSYLPAELPDRLHRWRSHLDQIRRGAHRDYLHAWYCYAMTRQVALRWQVLRDQAATARDRTNTWATRPALIPVREQILALPLPAVPPAPHWGADAPTEARLPVHSDLMVELARSWNSLVPNRQKVRIQQPPDFDDFVETALDDAALTDCLDWMDRATQDGYGLLLDW